MSTIPCTNSLLGVASVKTPRGEPLRRFKDQHKNTLLRTEINPINLETETAGRTNSRRADQEKKTKK